MIWCEYGEARLRLTQCLRLWPTDGETLLLAARAANRDGDVPEANRLLDAARTIAPEDAELEHLVFRMRMGDMGDTAGMLAACDSHNDDPQSKLIMEGLIEGALQTSQLDLAKSCLTLWDQTQKEPWDAAQAAAWRGELAFREGILDVALRHFREAVEAAPGNEQARLRLAEVLIQYGPAEGKAHLEFLKKKKPDSRDVLIRLARCHRELGEFEEAAKILDDLLARSNRDIAALIDRGRVALDIQQIDEAEQWFRKAETLGPELREVHLGLARCLHLAGKATEAQAYREKVVRADEGVQ